MTQPALKTVHRVLSPRERHWVGDGFFVSTILAPQLLPAELMSPFLLMDHAPPKHFPPGRVPKGVGEHPHRGFETVTFAYQGEVTHRDSSGGGGTIGSGDVQWMTAASGVVHEEKHSPDFTRSGGIFEMVQLWVNLPARLKMGPPRYQALEGLHFPRLDFGEARGRLIAGELQGQRGSAETHSPLLVFDLEMPAGSRAEFELPLGWSGLIFLLEGAARAQEAQALKAQDLLVLQPSSPGSVRLEAQEDSRVLVLSGEPLGEPVVAYGPFVMNSRQEILQAFQDFQAGRMGRL